jgi:AraC family transcriptional regulator
LAKIAVELEQALAERNAMGIPGRAVSRVLARGAGWRVADVICTSGPQDRPFEEKHADVSIAMVLAGNFQYRASANGSKTKNELMSPGSLLLGGAGQCFSCGHDHGAGDRCISFWYAPDYFERIASDAGVRRPKSTFSELKLPPLRPLSPLIARACVGLTDLAALAWEELSVEFAAQTSRLVNGTSSRNTEIPPSSHARISRALRTIEHSLESELSVEQLALVSGLSPYHFLRTFEAVTGVTPHQYILRTRLREAAIRVATERNKILDVALDTGFGDVSNFNRAFKSEFGMSPRVYRQQASG